MRSRPGLARLVRFGIVGVINTGTYYGLYLLFSMAVPYLAAHVAAFVLAMVGSYFLNCYVTFRTRPSWRTAALFPLTNLTNFVLTTVGLGIAVGKLGIEKHVAPLLVALLAIPVTFVVTHYVMLGPRATRADLEVAHPERSR